LIKRFQGNQCPRNGGRKKKVHERKRLSEKRGYTRGKQCVCPGGTTQNFRQKTFMKTSAAKRNNNLTEECSEGGGYKVPISMNGFQKKELVLGKKPILFSGLGDQSGGSEASNDIKHPPNPNFPPNPKTPPTQTPNHPEKNTHASKKLKNKPPPSPRSKKPPKSPLSVKKNSKNATKNNPTKYPLVSKKINHSSPSSTQKN